MAIAFVQATTNNTPASTSLVTTYPAAVQAGNTLICVIGIAGNQGVSSVSDNQFGTWTLAKQSNTNASCAIYYLPTAASSTLTPSVTVIINGSSTAGIGMTIAEFSGLTQIVDQTGATHNFGVATGTVSTSGATTSPNELVVAGVGTVGGQTNYTNNGAGYTLLGSDKVEGSVYLVTSSTGTQTASINWNSNSGFDMAIATFFASVSPGPVITRRYVHYYT